MENITFTDVLSAEEELEILMALGYSLNVGLVDIRESYLEKQDDAYLKRELAKYERCHVAHLTRLRERLGWMRKIKAGVNADPEPDRAKIERLNAFERDLHNPASAYFHNLNHIKFISALLAKRRQAALLALFNAACAETQAAGAEAAVKREAPATKKEKGAPLPKKPKVEQLSAIILFS